MIYRVVAYFEDDAGKRNLTKDFNTLKDANRYADDLFEIGCIVETIDCIR